MRNHPIIILAAVLTTLAASVHCAMAQDTYQLAGIYCPYPDIENTWTKAPAGYKAVYLSHFGRHGSRYHSSEMRYKRLLVILEKAAAADYLTEEGKSLLQDVRTVSTDAAGRYGSLTPLGETEHRHIMQRLCKHCPELFSGNDCKVEAYASQKQRCIMSMAASNDVIKEFNPKVSIARHSDERTQAELFSDGVTYTAASNAKAFLDERCRVTADSQPLMDRFFKDGGRYIHQDSRMVFGDLLRDFAAAAREASHLGTDIWRYFSAEELKPWWQGVNSKYYYNFGPSKEFSEISADQVSGLARHMLNSADDALSGGKCSASLRYGHDVQLMPLATFLGIEGCCKPAEEGQAVEEVWRGYEVSPMAGNIQMIFFRKGRSEDILVKVLLNEKESRLEGVETDCWPFYHWSELRKSLYDKLNGQPAFCLNGWQRDTVRTGLVYMRYSGFEPVSRANQIISVVDVDLNNPRYSVDFTFDPDRATTSEAFKAANAVASMNASYEKESVFIKTEGRIHYNIPSDIVLYDGAVPQWKTDCAVCTDGRRVSIEYTGKDKSIQQMREAYAAMEWPEVISSSPMLIENHVPTGKYFVPCNMTREEAESYDYEDPLRHQSVRHPRCAVALTDDNHMLLICVDGRRRGIAEGMNAYELTTFIESQFHAADAINMDGGGSSALCVAGRGKPGTNVVSYPSKTPCFAHEMERRVPTHIHILDRGEQ